MGQIDTMVCPVYMLTGEYDYSCSPAASKATADQIPGAIFEKMEGLGHFAATEDPTRFLPYLNKAFDHIQAIHKGIQAQ
jgi:pimeloyl-ACP methyl ester carboxylesterase